MIWPFLISKGPHLATQKSEHLFLRVVSLSIWRDSYVGEKQNRKDYKDFVRDYLPQLYDPSKLYTDLRCKLVHNYSEGGSYWLKDNQPQLHGQTVNGRTIINLENFVDDLENAFHRFMEQIQSDPSAKQKAIGRYNSIGLLCIGGLAPRKI